MSSKRTERETVLFFISKREDERIWLLTKYLSQVTVKAIPYNESENPAGGTTVTIG